MLHAEISRRQALKFGAAGAAAVAAGDALLATAAGAEEHDDVEEAEGVEAEHRRGRDGDRNDYNDDMFDVEAVKAGAWVPGPYGPDDQRGSFNEVTPRRTARALRRIQSNKVNTYQLGEEMFNGFPAFIGTPPRLHNMFLLAAGLQAPDDFIDGGGLQSGFTEPLGTNELTAFEERFAENFTFQIATQIDGLNHIGVGETYYNGFNWFEMLSPTGTTALGNETMGPIVTRGVILDIVGMKVAAGATDTYFIAPNGEPVLNGNYRITIDDIEHALYRQRIRRRLGPGDVVIFRTGWTHVKRDADVYLGAEPGIHLAEARYLADLRLAIVGSDTWGLEIIDPAIVGTNAFPAHQVLIVQHGIRIGESFVTDAAVADHCYDGVFVATPENVPGATCGSTPPAFLGQPGRRPRR